MAYNWLMMTSSGDDNWPSGSLGLLTDKTTKNKNRGAVETALEKTRLLTLSDSEQCEIQRIKVAMSHSTRKMDRL